MERCYKPARFVVVFVLVFVSGVLHSQNPELKLVKHDGQTLQVYPMDHHVRVVWGPENRRSGATSIVDGTANTHTIINVQGDWNQENYAANVCATLDAYGHSDWYLPSRQELQLLYETRNQIGGFASDSYWSSTDNEWGTEAVVFDFAGGFVRFESKSTMARVRCIRKNEAVLESQDVEQTQIQEIDPDSHWTLEYSDPVALAKEFIERTKIFWHPIGRTMVYATYKIGFPAARYGGRYLLLESPALAMGLVSSGGYATVSKVTYDAMLEIIKLAVASPDKLSEKLARSTINDGYDDYSKAYTIAREYLKTDKLKEQDALVFLCNRWNFLKLGVARQLYIQSRQQYDLNEQVAEATIKNILDHLEFSYKNKLDINQELPLIDAAFFIKDMMDIIASSGVGLADYPPYIQYVNNIESLNRIKLSEMQRLGYSSCDNFDAPAPLPENELLKNVQFEDLPDKFQDLLRHEYSRDPCYPEKTVWGGSGPFYSIGTSSHLIDLYMVWITGCPETRGRGQIVVFDDVVNQVVGSYFGYEVTGWSPEVELMQDINDHYPIIRIGSGRWVYDLTLESTSDTKIPQTGTFTDPRDGQTYQWVKIGDQVWMAENLNYAACTKQTFSGAYGGSDFPDGGCLCYNNDLGNCEKHGRLYNYDLARVICPVGWRLPTKNELNALLKHAKDHLGGFEALMEDGASGFNAVFSGTHAYFYGFGDIDKSANWWSGTGVHTLTVKYSPYIRYLETSDFQLIEGFLSYAVSVRCVKK